jgi:hypothetical protein
VSPDSGAASVALVCLQAFLETVEAALPETPVVLEPGNEGFAQAWPHEQGEFADKFNSLPKYVVSSTLEDPSWANTTAACSC